MKKHDDGRKQARRRAPVMARVIALILPVALGGIAPTRLPAQAPAGQSPSTPAERPSFDVASIKANKSSDNRIMMGIQPGGRYAATGAWLNVLITSAYQIKPQQLIGLPDWGNSEHFDIEAKADGNPTRDQMNLMMQSLLADRFKLAVHHETRQLPIYALVLWKPGKTGPQLTAHSDDAKCVDPKAGPPPPPPAPGQPPTLFCGGFFMSASPRGMHMTGQKVTMEIFVGLLSRQLDRVVVDRTGLGGAFDVNLEFAPQQALPGFGPPAEANGSDPSAPTSIFTAVQEQLGLKLEAQTGPVDVLVIDHVERPSEN